MCWLYVIAKYYYVVHGIQYMENTSTSVYLQKCLFISYYFMNLLYMYKVFSKWSEMGQIFFISILFGK